MVGWGWGGGWGQKLGCGGGSKSLVEKITKYYKKFINVVSYFELKYK